MTLTQARIEVDRAMAQLEKRGLSKDTVERLFNQPFRISDLREDLLALSGHIIRLTEAENEAIAEAKKVKDTSQLRRLFEGIAP